MVCADDVRSGGAQMPERENLGQSRTSFFIEWGGSADLSVRDIWPDGNAPENPTVEDVMAEMRKEGSLRRLCQNWDLNIEGVEVEGKNVRFDA